MNPSLFGSFVQTMRNPKSAHLSSLHFCQAQGVKDDASNNKMDCLTKYAEISGLEVHQNRISGSKVMVILLNLTEQLVSCPV